MLISFILDRWTTHEVGEWLERIGLGMYKERFREYEVDGELLLNAVAESILLCALHVRIRLHRWKILQQIDKLRHFSADTKMKSSASVHASKVNNRSWHHRCVGDCSESASTFAL